MNIDPLKYAGKITQQRNAAFDEVALASAAIEMLQAEIAELKKKIEELEKR